MSFEVILEVIDGCLNVPLVPNGMKDLGDRETDSINFNL